MRNLRAGVIGLGWAGTVHCQVLEALAGVDLVAVADTAYRDVSHLLTLGLDYCVVATPTETHEQIGILLAEVGINAIIEKPLASTLTAANKLIEAFATNGLVATVGHTERRNPAIREVATRLRDGEFGAIHAISTRRNSPFPERIRDVGVVTDIAIHDVDLAAWLAARPIESVSARIRHVSGHPHEDLATAVCKLDDETLATIQVSRITPFKERILTVHAEAGTITADAVSRTVTHYTSAGALTSEITGPEPFQAQHEAFLDALRGRGDDIVSLSEGAAAVAVTEAIHRSARTGTACAVENLEANPR
ncbi:Gfo/Idh/MocA family protein [Nonomuraea sp. NPDC050556]|uniref:Gfo/Idh/MocA family protein n=1 Tax=Nonomuraea sp. NPDC050556 TaxID=3364369 RepID=UPI0037B48AD8